MVGLLAVARGPRGRRAAVDGLAAAGFASIVNTLAKRLVRRRRPRGLTTVAARHRGRTPRTSSFPSGHMASATAFAVAAASQAPLAAPGLMVAAAAVGWSRMYAGRHFPSDVIGGAAIGATVGGAFHAFGHRIRRG
ncbi:MAG: phosphatase PAP2 family protein [Actinomycetota bacterium]|nr:phosphatase PAP2 family protein [Actinomycetota bacterium]